MSLVFTGATGTTSATIPSHVAGDLIVAFAYRDGSTTVPSLPSGQNWTNVFSSTGANTNSHRIAAKIATSSGETTGTFTNATSLVVVVIHSSTGISLGYKNGASGSGASTTLSFTGFTLDNPASSSKILAFAGHRSVNTTTNTAPAGFTNITSVLDATDEAAAHASTSVVSSFSTTTQSVGGTSSGWRTHTLEVYENPNVTVALTGQELTSGGGSLTPVGGDPYVICFAHAYSAQASGSGTSPQTTSSFNSTNNGQPVTLLAQILTQNVLTLPDTNRIYDSAGNIWVQVGTDQSYVGGNAGSVLYKCENANTSATHTVSINKRSGYTDNEATIWVKAFKNVSTSGSIGDWDYGDVDDYTSPTITTTGNGSCVVNFYGAADYTGNINNYIPPAGWVEEDEVPNSNGYNSGSTAVKSNIGNATNVDITWSATYGVSAQSSNWIIEIKAGDSPDKNATLTGISTTFALGTLSTSTTKTLTGSELVSAAGTLTPSIAVNVNLTGQEASFSAGLFGVSRDKVLSGSAITSASGTVIAALSKVITGQAITGNTGTLIAGTNKVLTGSELTNSLGTLIPTISRALAGVEAVFSAGTISLPTGGDVTVGLDGVEFSSVPGTVTITASVGLTGNQITLSAGSLGTQRTVGLSGVSATYSTGILSVDTSKAISGLLVSTAQGSVAAAISKALVGSQITFAAGSVGVSGIAVWPSEADVRDGIVYGPDGNNYTGTLVSTGTVPEFVIDVVSGKIMRVVLLGNTIGVAPIE